MREIELEDIESGNLTWAEAVWLRDRGRLPADFEMPEEEEDEDYEAPTAPKSRVTPLEDQAVPTIGANGGIVDDEEDEDYDEGWNNNQRRAELSRRGLSVDGNKDELTARLRRSDVDELIDGDSA